MINLLPQDVKDEYSYALRNTQLRRWIVACFMAFVGVGIIATYGIIATQNTTDNYNRQVAQVTKDLDAQKLNETTTQVTDITNSFKLVVQVLSKEVLFSKLLKQIATVIPSNASLENLNINQTTGGVDIVANAADYDTATQVQVNLSDPNNKIFSKADIVSIVCTESASNPRYPCSVQVRALFAAKNQFLFINDADGVKK